MRILELWSFALAKHSRENICARVGASSRPAAAARGLEPHYSKIKTVRVAPTPKLGLAKAGQALAEAALRVEKRWEPATPKAQAAI